MKKISFTIISILLSSYFSFSQIYNSIDSIYTVPEIITETDSINVIFNGYKSSGGIAHDSLSLNIEGSAIEIILHFHLGMGPMMPSSWVNELMISPLSSGDYNIIIKEKDDNQTNSNVIDSLKIEITENSTIKEINIQDRFVNIYPNPVIEDANIHYRIDENGNYKVSISSLNGKVIEVIKDSFHTVGDYELTWASTKLSKGIYLLSLSSANKNEIIK